MDLFTMERENDTPSDDGTVIDSADDIDTSVDALADVLGDLDDDPDTNEDEGHAEDDGDVDLSDEDAGDEDEETDSEEDSDDDADEDGEDGPDEPLKGGRIAPNNAKVKLPDGSLTTVEELSKGYLRQSDYTRKTQELSTDRKAIDEERQRVSQTAQQLSDQHERVNTMLEQWKPQPPQNAQNDPMAWIQYQQQQANWEAWQKQIGDSLNETREKQQSEFQQQIQEQKRKERSALAEKVPALADDTKLRSFLDEAGKVLGEYGISQQEVDAIGDHRMILVLRDLLRSKRLSAKAPQVKEKIKEKPKMLTGSKRSNPKATQRKGKEARMSRLRETGSVADGTRALMDLDL